MMRLFAVRDVKADSFGAPISVATEGLARRSFSDACKDPRSELAKYPEDYMLYELGTYEPNAGAITPHKLPKLVMTAIEAVKVAAVVPAVEEVR